jgi:hypothetical protein
MSETIFYILLQFHVAISCFFAGVWAVESFDGSKWMVSCLKVVVIMIFGLEIGMFIFVYHTIQALVEYTRWQDFRYYLSKRSSNLSEEQIGHLKWYYKKAVEEKNWFAKTSLRLIMKKNNVTL